MDIEFYDLVDSKEKFELKINGVPIKCVSSYKLEGTPFEKKLFLELSIPSENIKVQATSSQKH